MRDLAIAPKRDLTPRNRPVATREPPILDAWYTVEESKFLHGYKFGNQPPLHVQVRAKATDIRLGMGVNRKS